MNRNVKIFGLIIIAITVILFSLYYFMMANTKKHSPLEVVELRENGLEADIAYCRPYKKGRIVFGTEEEGALQPYGQYWRMGANEATVLTVNEPINFGGEELGPGSYSIYAFPGEGEWQIGINTDIGQWGFSEPNFDNEVFRVTVPVEYVNEITEQLTINFETVGENTNMVLRWDNAVVKIPIR